MSLPDRGSLPDRVTFENNSHASPNFAARFVYPALRYGVLTLAAVTIAWPSEAPKTQAGLSGSEWRVVEIGGQEANGAGTLRFTMTSIRGKTSCNSFMGAFREIGGSIEIAGVGVTRMLCDGQSEMERMFFDALASARSYIMDGATLVLRDSSGKVLVKFAG